MGSQLRHAAVLCPVRHRAGERRTVRVRETGMKVIGLVLSILASSAVAHAGAPEPYLAVSGLKNSEVSVFELRSSDESLPPGESFNGRRITCWKPLNQSERTQFLALLEMAEAREASERAEAAASGQVTGGVLACVTEEYGIRFSLPDGPEDSFITLECQRIYPVERTGRILVAFNESETEQLRRFLREVLRCP